MQNKTRVERLEELTNAKVQKVIVLYYDEVTDEEIQVYEDDGCFVIIINFV